MIKILIDSASDIDEAEAVEKGIFMIPIEVNFNGETYYDGVNLSHNDFFCKLIESDDLPKTSQINPFRFTEEFEKLTKDGSKVICITLSSKLSNTYQNAVVAAKEFPDQVYVVDSLNACIGERILCDYAIQLIASGMDIEAIVKELNVKKNQIELLAVVGTLKYLKKGGRISSVVAYTGESLSISVPQAAKLLNISKPTAYILARREDFPSFQVGNRILVSVAGLAEWVEAQAGTRNDG